MNLFLAIFIPLNMPILVSLIKPSISKISISRDKAQHNLQTWLFIFYSSIYLIKMYFLDKSSSFQLEPGLHQNHFIGFGVQACVYSKVPQQSRMTQEAIFNPNKAGIYEMVP